MKEKDNNISQTIVKLEEYFELDLAKRDSLHGILRRIRDTVRKSKKSLDSIGGEWWNSVILESDFKKRRDTENSSVHYRKSIDNLSLKQQRLRLSTVLDTIRVLAEIEKNSEIKIAALALQLVSNQFDARQVANVSKLIVTESFSGDFGKVVKKDVDVDKSLFLLDMLVIGKRKILNCANTYSLVIFNFLLTIR